MNCSTATQVTIRQRLSENHQAAFDVEFARQRLNKLWFFFLWGFFGFVFGHSVYFYLKTRDICLEDRAYTTWLWAGPVMFWTGPIFMGPFGPLVGLALILMTGVYLLASSEMDRVNDKIAEAVACSVKRI